MLEDYQEKFLADVKNNGNIILVEGKKDRRVLEKVGFQSLVEISGKQLEKVVNILTEKQLRVIILTDYDKEGIRQYKRLKSLLLSNGIGIDDKTRRDFKRMFRITKIEELTHYLK